MTSQLSQCPCCVRVHLCVLGTRKHRTTFSSWTGAGWRVFMAWLKRNSCRSPVLSSIIGSPFSGLFSPSHDTAGTSKSLNMSLLTSVWGAVSVRYWKPLAGSDAASASCRPSAPFPAITALCWTVRRRATHTTKCWKRNKFFIQFSDYLNRVIFSHAYLWYWYSEK